MVAHYEGVVKSTHPARPAAVKHVASLLASGLTEQRLKACADGYAYRCKKGETDYRYRQAAQTFYRADGAHAKFLAWDGPPRPVYAPIPELPRPTNTISVAEARKIVAQRRAESAQAASQEATESATGPEAVQAVASPPATPQTQQTGIQQGTRA